MVGPGQLHTRFKTPEGHFNLFSERPTRVGFSAQVCNHLTASMTERIHHFSRARSTDLGV